MVYSVTIKNKLTYKQDVSTVEALLANQQSAYAILRYNTEIPSRLYSLTMKQLACEVDKITYRKLRDLVKKFIKASGCVILMDEEIESSIFVDPKTGKVLTEDQIEEVDGVAYIKEDAQVLLDCMEDDDDDDDDDVSPVTMGHFLLTSDNYGG